MSAIRSHVVSMSYFFSYGTLERESIVCTCELVDTHLLHMIGW